MLIADPQVVAIPVEECGEPLVSVQGFAVSDHKAALGAERLYLRSGVAERLAQAASPEESDGACYTAATTISAEAAAHRAVLGAAMTAAGFINYPTEWWHWSYGDRYWALRTGAPAALYGPHEASEA